MAQMLIRRVFSSNQLITKHCRLFCSGSSSDEGPSNTNKSFKQKSSKKRDTLSKNQNKVSEIKDKNKQDTLPIKDDLISLSKLEDPLPGQLQKHSQPTLKSKQDENLKEIKKSSGDNFVFSKNKNTPKNKRKSQSIEQEMTSAAKLVAEHLVVDKTEDVQKVVNNLMNPDLVQGVKGKQPIDTPDASQSPKDDLISLSCLNTDSSQRFRRKSISKQNNGTESKQSGSSRYVPEDRTKDMRSNLFNMKNQPSESSKYVPEDSDSFVSITDFFNKRKKRYDTTDQRERWQSRSSSADSETSQTGNEGWERQASSHFDIPEPKVSDFIFELRPDTTEAEEAESTNKVFDYIRAREFRKLMMLPPNNQFEEWIQWTKDGKLWHFPIDNEQGMLEEKATGFHEHVFLDWRSPELPQQGPIANFMDLVCVGLAKNPYFSVQQKWAHINWLSTYLKNKLKLVEESVAEAKKQREREDKIRAGKIAATS